MLRNTTDLHHYAIHATDGMVGSVKDLYFDDQAWVIRYLVVDTGDWLPGRKVLVSPMLFEVPEWEARELTVNRTCEQIRNSPDIDTERPVSRQQEAAYLSYYNYPFYWGGAGLWGGEMYPELLGPARGSLLSAVPGAVAGAASGDGLAQDQAALEDKGDPHLRSCLAVTGHHILAIDGSIGHVNGFLVDDRTWAIRYLVVDTSNWWMGHKVLIAPLWIDAVDWASRSVTVNLTRQAIQSAPPYDPAVQPDRAQELRLYQHYERPDYWTPAADQKRPSLRA